MASPGDRDPGQEVVEVDLAVKNVYSGGETRSFRLPLTTTLAQLKLEVQKAFDGRPEPRSQRLIYCGKICSDDATLKDVLSLMDVGSLQVFHLVLSNPNSPQRSQSSPRGVPPAVSPSPSPSPSPLPSPSRRAAPVQEPAPASAGAAPSAMQIAEPRRPPAPAASESLEDLGAQVTDSHHPWNALCLEALQNGGWDTPAVAAEQQCGSLLALVQQAANAGSWNIGGEVQPPVGGVNVPGPASGTAVRAYNVGLGNAGAGGGNAAASPAAAAAAGAQRRAAADGHAADPALRRAAAGADGAPRQGRRSILLMFDLKLALKMVAMVLLLGQDGDPVRVATLSCAALMGFLIQTGILAAFMQLFQGAPAGDDLTPQAGAAQGAGPRRRLRSMSEGSIAPAGHGGVMSDITYLVIGFFCSLLPTWKPTLDQVAPQTN